MHTDYLNPAIRQLRDQQVRFAPREKKLEQAEQAEKLLGELDSRRVYSYQYVCFRVTSFRPDAYPDLQLTGQEASHDLRLFVEDVSDAANVSTDSMDESVLTVDELADRFRVSTKTISRWRRQGLVSRRFVMDGRKRVGFLQSSVDRFVQRNPERVRRGTRFSQLSESERIAIIEQARRFAREGGCPAEVTKRLAKQMGRSCETIRYTLRQFDEEHPDLAIFPDSHGPLRLETKQRIYEQYHRGESVEKLADHFCRTRTSIYRTIAEIRAQHVLELPLDHIPNEEFAQILAGGNDSEIVGTMPLSEVPSKSPRLPSGLPPYLAALYEVPLLTREQEAHLFRKMNYLKFKASKLREEMDPARPKTSLMDEIDRYYDETVKTKNQIIRANLRLVVSIAKRHMNSGENFFELVSDGNVSLMRAAEKFDYARGNKFSTYASWAIIKNFARTIPDEHRRRDRFRTSQAEMFTSAEDNRSDQFEQESAQLHREAQVERILGRLDEREQSIIIRRFGLRRGQEPLTLKQVGAELGVTKERIRQIESRALSKLRKVAEEEKIDFLG